LFVFNVVEFIALLGLGLNEKYASAKRKKDETFFEFQNGFFLEEFRGFQTTYFFFNRE
jgi:hypothetical protein